MKTLADLAAIKEQMQPIVRLNRQPEDGTRIVVGLATCGISAGAVPVLEALQKAIEEQGLKDVKAYRTGCIGVCLHEPLVEVYKPGEEKVTYVSMTPEKVLEVLEKHVKGGQVVAEYTITAQ